MSLINYRPEINRRCLLPGLCGDDNLQHIYSRVPQETRGKMISLATEMDRTLFFDFLPLELGQIRGFRTRFHLYTVPGQVYYNASRKLILKGVDGIVFVADSQIDRFDANVESLVNMHDNLAERGLATDKIPIVMQYNKRDLPRVVSVGDLERELNPQGVPFYESVALRGTGVFDTLKLACKLVLKTLG